MARCRKCNRTEGDLAEAGVWLERVNPVGEMPALWECRPSCQGGLTQEQAIVGAVSGCACGPDQCCPNCCPVHRRPNGSRRNQ